MEWKKSKPPVFWGEIAPQKHIVQFYEDEQSFLDILTGYVGVGINAGESVIIIATNEHLDEIKQRLLAHGIHVNSLLHQHQYIPIIAEDLMSKFMINGMPDPALFNKEIESILEKVRDINSIRAFGEMVGLLMRKSNVQATIALERLWNKVCQKYRLSLFCAYPTAVLKGNEQVFHDICDCHAKVITTKSPCGEILYRTMPAAISDKKTIC